MKKSFLIAIINRKSFLLSPLIKIREPPAILTPDEVTDLIIE